MKTRFFSLLAILILTIPMAIAQSTDVAKISFAVLGGVNFQNFTGKDENGDKLKNDMIVGYHGGVNVQLPIVLQFYFQPGLMFTTKGGKDEAKITARISYIELPLNLVYKSFKGKGYIMIALGPYIGYGVSAKIIDEDGEKTDVEFKEVVEADDPAGVYCRAFDAGANLFAGYEMANGLFFQLNTQLGLININPEDKHMPDDQASAKNTGFGLSVGYRF